MLKLKCHPYQRIDRSSAADQDQLNKNSNQILLIWTQFISIIYFQKETFRFCLIISLSWTNWAWWCECSLHITIRMLLSMILKLLNTLSKLFYTTNLMKFDIDADKGSKRNCDLWTWTWESVRIHWWQTFIFSETCIFYFFIDCLLTKCSIVNQD